MLPTDGPPVDAYRSPLWLPGPHAQTIWPALIAPRPRLRYHRERWDTPDGDFVDLDFTQQPVSGPTAPTTHLLLFHGLEGASTSHYALSIMQACNERGWLGVVPHFRGCSGEANRLPRAYHSGDSNEIDWIVRRYRERIAPDTRLYVAGVSLGGNAMLKWLGEQGQAAAGLVRAAAGVSAPQDLEAGATSLARGFNRLYTRNFLGTLKRKSLAKLEQFPGLYDRERMLRSRTFFDFDDIVTAPLHGFESCYDYWRRSSSRRFLADIRVPTLVLNARNDPFMPASALARADEVAPDVLLEYPDHGGHVGFMRGAPPGRLDWLPARLFRFFEQGT